MQTQTIVNRVVATAKADAWSKAKGGFAVVQLSNGEIEYFHFGETPNIAGEPDRQAKILGKWSWNAQRWSRIA